MPKQAELRKVYPDDPDYPHETMLVSSTFEIYVEVSHGGDGEELAEDCAFVVQRYLDRRAECRNPVAGVHKYRALPLWLTEAEVEAARAQREPAATSAPSLPLRAPIV